MNVERPVRRSIESRVVGVANTTSSAVAKTAGSPSGESTALCEEGRVKFPAPNGAREMRKMSLLTGVTVTTPPGVAISVELPDVAIDPLPGITAAVTMAPPAIRPAATILSFFMLSYKCSE